jgi:hypothetical protein
LRGNTEVTRATKLGNRSRASEQIDALKALLPEHVRVIIGGAASRALGHLPLGFEVFDRLDDLDSVL